MRERVIEQKVCAAATANGWLAFKWQSPQNRGVPDRIFIREGRFIAVEFKAPGKRPSKLQQHVHEHLRKEGVEVHVIDSIEDGIALFAG